MPAAITEFVDVTVLPQGGVADKFSFGTLMGVFSHNVNFDRQSGPYFSLAEVVAAGFTSLATPEINAWATSVFSQDDGVDQILIGRRVPATGGAAEQVWQVDDDGGPSYVDMTSEYNDATVANFIPFVDPEAIEDSVAFGASEPFAQLVMDNTGGTAGVGGVVAWEYWNGSTWTAVAGLVDGTTGFTAAVSAGQTVSWTLPVDWAPTDLNGVSLYYVRARITTVFATNPIYDAGTLAGDASWTVTMDAINAAGSETWYITNIESRADADILQVAAWSEAKAKIYIAQSSSSDFLNGVASNIGEQLEAFGYNRTALVYHATDTGSDGYLDGAWSSSGGGLNLDVPGGVGVWAYRQLEGVTFDGVTGAQATNIYDVNGNLYGRNLSLSFTSKGTMAAGAPRFIDVTSTIDWTKKRIEEATLSLFVATPTKISYTNGGINQVVSVVQGVLDSGVTFGHFSPDFPPTIKAPLASEVSSEAKQNRELTLKAEAVIAGAIQKLILTVNLSF